MWVSIGAVAITDHLAGFLADVQPLVRGEDVCRDIEIHIADVAWDVNLVGIKAASLPVVALLI